MREESRLIFVSKDQKKVKEYRISRKKLITFISIFLIAFLISGKIGLDLLVSFSHNSKIERLERANIVLEMRLSEIQERMSVIKEEIELVNSKDDELRTVMGLDKLSNDIRDVGIGGSRYDYELTDEISGFNNKTELSKQLMELAKMEREIKLEKESYSNLLATFQKKQDSLAYLPALRPVLRGVITSRFGMRRHPVYNVYRHHDGLDINAPRGTPIYAAADGVVQYANSNGGYGKMVILDHKYGYETRYGHMNRILVRRGQKVKRGEKIGEVGNSGITTAPHLHYEVRLNSKPLDPRLYYFDDNILNEQVAQN